MAPHYSIITQKAKKLLMRPVRYYLKDRALNTLVTYGGIKAVVLLGALIAAFIATAIHQLPALPSFPYSLTNWDGSWYTNIAYSGYAYNYPYSAAFPPMYPFLIKVASFNQLTLIPWVAIILSNAFSFVALYFLYQLAPLVVGKKYRLRTCFAYMVFPVLIVCGLVAYSETIFLAFTIGAYYFWKRSKFGFATLLALGSVFTRQVGALILVVFAVDALYAYWSRRDAKLAYRQLIVIGVTCASVAALYLFYYVVFGNALILAHVEATNWGNALSPANVFYVIGLSLAGIDVRPIAASAIPSPVPLIILGAIVVVFAAICLRRRDVALSIYSLFSVTLFLSMSARQSFVRYVAAIFPIYLFFGLLLSSNWKKNLFVGVLAVAIAVQNMYIWLSGAWLY